MREAMSPKGTDPSRYEHMVTAIALNAVKMTGLL